MLHSHSTRRAKRIYHSRRNCCNNRETVRKARKGTEEFSALVLTLHLIQLSECVHLPASETPQIFMNSLKHISR